MRGMVAAPVSTTSPAVGSPVLLLSNRACPQPNEFFCNFFVIFLHPAAYQIRKQDQVPVEYQ